MFLNFAIFILCGAVSGFLSGLLGIGGGLIYVPLMMIIFEMTQEIPAPYIMHAVAATSISSALFTSFSSSFAQNKHHNVLWDLVKTMCPFIITGALLGTWLTKYLSADIMRIFLVIFLVTMGTQMLMGLTVQSAKRTFGKLFYRISAFCIGTFSIFVGSSGGSIFVPFLNYTTGNMHKAIGTAPALAWNLSLFGSIGYLISGLSVTELPSTTIGYIHLPALVCIAISSVLVAPFGVKVSHKMPVAFLRKVFAVFLYISALRAIYSIIF